jgi:prevent-host-death family protein
LCYTLGVSEVGLREMRQYASDLVRRAEAGERVTITVAGRPAAVLGPVAPRVWRQWADLVDLFREPVDADWPTDRDRLDDAPADPWA